MRSPHRQYTTIIKKTKIMPAYIISLINPGI